MSYSLEVMLIHWHFLSLPVLRTQISQRADSVSGRNEEQQMQLVDKIVKVTIQYSKSFNRPQQNITSLVQRGLSIWEILF